MVPIMSFLPGWVRTKILLRLASRKVSKMGTVISRTIRSDLFQSLSPFLRYLRYTISSQKKLTGTYASLQGARYMDAARSTTQSRFLGSSWAYAMASTFVVI